MKNTILLSIFLLALASCTKYPKEYSCLYKQTEDGVVVLEQRQKVTFDSKEDYEAHMKQLNTKFGNVVVFFECDKLP